jgi:hypothetical protein
MAQIVPAYFLNSKKVLLSIGIAFFVTNFIELLILFLLSLLSSRPIGVNALTYFIQSFTIVYGLWLSFRFLKNAPIYLIALSVAIFSTLVLSIVSFISSSDFFKELVLTNFISSFVLIFIWMHLTQNLENKPRALKVGYFSYFIAIECLSLIPSSIRGENHVVFLLIALIGYKISSVIFELGIKTGFKIFNVSVS